MDVIRRAILDGTLEPGERLTEEGLARDLEISRTPVREALRVLRAEGLAASAPYHGSTVRADAAGDRAVGPRGDAATVDQGAVDDGDALLGRADRDRTLTEARGVTGHRGTGGGGARGGHHQAGRRDGEANELLRHCLVFLSWRNH